MPPLLLADTCYAPGLGVTEALGSAFDFFRGYVRFVDNPVQSDVRGHVQRHICCVRGTRNFLVDFKGDAAQAERLAQAPRGSHAHALLAWQDTDKLNLIAAMLVNEEHREMFGKFFQAEANIYTALATSDSAQRTAIEETPLRQLTAAMKANVTSPPRWRAPKIVTTPNS